MTAIRCWPAAPPRPPWCRLRLTSLPLSVVVRPPAASRLAPASASGVGAGRRRGTPRRRCRSTAARRSGPRRCRPRWRPSRRGRRAPAASAVSRPRCSRIEALLGAVVEDHQRRAAGPPLVAVVERVGEHVGGAGRGDHRQQVLGVAGQRRAPAGAPDRLGHPAGGPGREHRAAPHQRRGVGERDRQHLGRVDGEVAVRRAGDRHVVEGLRHRLGVGVRPEVDAGRGPRSITTAAASWSPRRARQHRAVAAGGVLGDQRARRAGDHHPAAAADRLGDRGGRSGVAALGREHDDEVERRRPSRAGTAPARPRTAPGTTARAPRGAAGSPGRRRRRPAGGPRPRAPATAAAIASAALAGLTPDPGAGLGEVPQRLVVRRERGLVVEPRVVEDLGHGRT